MEDFGKGDGVGEGGEGWLRGEGGIVGCWVKVGEVFMGGIGGW